MTAAAPTVPGDNDGASSCLADQLARWKERLRSLTDLSLPTCYPRPLPLPIIESQLCRELDDSTCLQLLALSMKLLPLNHSSSPNSSSQITPFTLLLASFTVLLHRHTGEDDIVIGSSSSQCNPLVLRLPVNGGQSFADLVAEVKRVEEEAIADEVPFDALLGALADQTNKSTLTKVRFFNRTDTNSDTLASHASDLTVFIAQSPTARRLLPIEVRVIYNAVLFSAERIDSILDQLIEIVHQVTAVSLNCVLLLYNLYLTRIQISLWSRLI
jgi:L-aminoadipate-semialdehyde dehydrogenase